MRRGKGTGGRSWHMVRRKDEAKETLSTPKTLDHLSEQLPSSGARIHQESKKNKNRQTKNQHRGSVISPQTVFRQFSSRMQGCKHHFPLSHFFTAAIPSCHAGAIPDLIHSCLDNRKIKGKHKIRNRGLFLLLLLTLSTCSGEGRMCMGRQISTVSRGADGHPGRMPQPGECCRI